MGQTSITRLEGSANPAWHLLAGQLPGTQDRFAGCDLTFLHQMAESLGRAIDARDPNTALHSEHVAELSLLIARTFGLTETECSLIHIAGHLHDIGKIGVTDAVLLKEGRLSREEQLEMQCHPEIGAGIVAPVGLCATPGGIAETIRCHHEWYDGSGYPAGLRGEAIPLGARIVAVADTYSALIQNRPYRPGSTPELALAEIVRCAGTQFDPAVVKKFASIFDQGTIGGELLTGRSYFIPGTAMTDDVKKEAEVFPYRP